MVDQEEAREAELHRREAAVAAREAAIAQRAEGTQAILDAADKRDATADDRDEAAQTRENDHDRAQFMGPDTERDYAGDWPLRRHAGCDREHAKVDSETSHEDRIRLTEDDAEQDGDHP